MKKVFLITVALLLCGMVFAQVTEKEESLRKSAADTLDGWKAGGIGSLNVNQVSLTNWSAGGENSVSGAVLINLFANYKKGKSTWDNSLDIGYGLLKQGDKDVIKADDKIDFMSKYGREAFKNWYYAALLNFKTQMTPGYNYPNDSVKISDFLSPAYLLGALGMDYKPSDNFTFFVAPFTAKMTIVNDQTLADAGAFGVDPGDNLRTEFGGYIRTMYKAEIMKNISFQTKLDLFSNYANNPENIDVSWETMINMKVNKYVTASITTHLLYDDDIDIMSQEGENLGPKTQFKEVLAVGLSYKF